MEFKINNNNTVQNSIPKISNKQEGYINSQNVVFDQKVK